MNDIIRILSDWNLWWETGHVSPELAGKRRGYTQRLLELVGTREIKILTGVRRSGKSTLFYQLIDWLLSEKAVSPRRILLVNFEDQALAHYSLDDIFNAFQTHLAPEGEIYLFLDEIQQKSGWERWLRKKYDLKENIQFFLTGSCAGLLAPEYATLLTGRNIASTIYPLSFKEALSFSGIEVADISLLSQKKRNRINKVLMDYLFNGGFPELVFHKQNLKRRLLNQYFSDIVYRDIVYRHGCHAARIKDLSGYLMTNIGTLTTMRALRGIFGYGLNTIGEYLGYLEDAFLVFQMHVFDFSVKKQLVNPRKVYAVDNGLRNAVAFKFSRDTGRLMENAVFMELKRRSKDVFYWKDKRGREVDFVIREGMNIQHAIQVCADPEDEKTNKRELAGLNAALQAFDLKRGVIVTLDTAGETKMENRRITYVPISEWLLAED